MQKIFDYLKKQTVIILILRGGTYGFIIWFFHTIIYRAIGLKPLFYYNIAEFIVGGMIIGGIIGLATDAINERHK